MKKNYINPATIIVSVEAQNFIATSITTENGEVKSVQMGGDFEGGAGDVKSRSTGDWFDED